LTHTYVHITHTLTSSKFQDYALAVSRTLISDSCKTFQWDLDFSIQTRDREISG